jgi:recombination protein RecT
MSGQQQLTTAPPTRAEFRTLRECKTLSDAFNCGEFMERIKASAPSHVKPQRMLRTFVQATSKSPLLLQCSMRSVLGAMLTCSEVGLEPNTPLQHAFLIPFGRYKWNKATRERELQGYEVQLIFGYPGLLDLSYRSGNVTSVHAGVAYKDEYDGGRFSFEYGTNAHLTHRPERARPDEEIPAYGYAHASLTNGQAFEVMPWADIMKIRNGSQGFRSALAAKEAAEKKNWKLPATWTEAPWVKHDRKMAGKTVFRALSTWLPRSVELAGVLALDETQDRGTVDFGAVIDGQASIEGGGFQESGPLIEDEADSTATFGLRTVVTPGPEDEEDDPSPPPTQTAPVPTPPPPAAKTKPGPKPRPPTEVVGELPLASKPPPAVTVGQSPAFAAWLVNGDGEPIDSEDGPAERFTDPVAYARALIHTLETVFPGDRDLIQAANADDAAEAARVSDEAKSILFLKPPPAAVENPISQQAPKEEPQAERWQMPVPAANKQSWEIWNNQLHTLLGQALVPDQLSRIIELNAPIYADFAPKYRTAAKAMVEARQMALTKKAPEPQQTPAEVMNALYSELLELLVACKTSADIDELAGDQAVIRKIATLKVGDRAKGDAVQAQARKRREELKAAEDAA